MVDFGLYYKNDACLRAKFRSKMKNHIVIHKKYIFFYGNLLTPNFYAHTQALQLTRQQEDKWC